jgi:hypothetical protein
MFRGGSSPALLRHSQRLDAGGARYEAVALLNASSTRFEAVALQRYTGLKAALTLVTALVALRLAPLSAVALACCCWKQTWRLALWIQAAEVQAGPVPSTISWSGQPLNQLARAAVLSLTALRLTCTQTSVSRVIM